MHVVALVALCCLWPVPWLCFEFVAVLASLLHGNGHMKLAGRVDSRFAETDRRLGFEKHGSVKAIR